MKTPPYTDFIDITGTNAGKAPLVRGDVRAYYATGTDGIEETARQIREAKAAGMGVILIDQTPSLAVFSAGLAAVADIEQFAGTNVSAAEAVADRQAAGLDSVLYCSMDAWASLKDSIADPKDVSYWIADYSFSRRMAVLFLAAHPDVVAFQYGDPASNPNTLVPGTDVNLTQCQADIDVAKTTWTARFLPAAHKKGHPIMPPEPFPGTPPPTPNPIARVRKLLVFIVGMAAMFSVQLGLTSNHWVQLIVAAATALGVYTVPNAAKR